ncbi:hypothetical protein LPJ72_002878 [Coemansia sp. Benny D160-2]|nr:hypothetical protein LPJ72_002878 [Coemansia sp. Benny D160-2]
MTESKNETPPPAVDGDRKVSSVSTAPSEEELITVSPLIRYLNHALSGVTETSKVAVRINKSTLESEFEPVKPWIQRTTTAALFGISTWAVWYRRRRLDRVGGLVSLAGASRPVLSGVSWAAGIAGGLNSRAMLTGNQKTDR